MKRSPTKKDARVLIVEDEMIVAKDIQTRLDTLGYTITAIVTTGNAAVRKAQKGDIDIILMDIRLKGEIDGVKAATQIQQQYAIPVVFLTAYADHNTVERAKVSEPFGYIIKPVSDNELRTSIEIALYKGRVQKQLRQSEKRFRDIFENANDVIAFVDTRGIIREINKKVKSVFGYTPRLLIGKRFTDLPIMTDHQLAMLAKHFATIAKKKSKQVLLELEIKSKQKKTVHVEVNAQYIKDHDGRDGFLTIIRDITKRKKMERELVQEQKKSQELTKKIINAQEEERLILASEIHDELLQGLVAILYFLQKLDVSKLDKKSQARTTQLIHMIKSSIEHGRALISDIEPLRNLKIGLIPAIKNIINQRYSTLGTKITLKASNTIPALDHFSKVNIVRIVQEAMRNAQKHAEPGHILVKINKIKQYLIIEVCDDGAGFDVGDHLSRKDTKHYGLLTMQERARLIGGTVTIKSLPGRGTSIKARFPIKNIR